MILIGLLLVVVVVLALWALDSRNAARAKAAHDAALRIETEKAVQAQRAKEDALCVTTAAAQDRPKRRKKACR